MLEIDLNADLGEGYGGDKKLLGVITSCSIACGGHAGNRFTMAATVRQALANGVVIGAHPGYPDRENFGRKSGYLSGNALFNSLFAQVAALAETCEQLGAMLSHVKPHGALYNDAVTNRDVADIIASVTSKHPDKPALMGISGSALETAADVHGLRFVPEGFVDRAYESDSSLVSRSELGALHTDLSTITFQAASIAERKIVIARDGRTVKVSSETLCIHGDAPGAVRTARAIREVLERRRVLVRAYQNR